MKAKTRIRILSIDGGGMRGIIPASILKYAEEYLQKKVPGSKLADHFDFIAGTSTGGILSCIYLAPDKNDKTKARFSAAQALDFYVNDGYKIFNASKRSDISRLWGLLSANKYSAKNLDLMLREKFGQLKLSQLIKPCLITAYDLESKSSIFFTSREDTNKREFLVSEVARSTSAAPTFFTPAHIKNLSTGKEMMNIDGGVFAGNPLMCAFAEVRKTKFESREVEKASIGQMYILSLGTGANYKLKGHSNSDKWGLLKWAVSIPDIMMDGAVDTVDYQMKEIFKSIDEEHSGQYLRIDVADNERNYSDNMADASPQNIKDLLAAGENLVNKNKDVLNNFLDGLLE